MDRKLYHLPDPVEFQDGNFYYLFVVKRPNESTVVWLVSDPTHMSQYNTIDIAKDFGEIINNQDAFHFNMDYPFSQGLYAFLLENGVIDSKGEFFISSAGMYPLCYLRTSTLQDVTFHYFSQTD